MLTAIQCTGWQAAVLREQAPSLISSQIRTMSNIRARVRARFSKGEPKVAPTVPFVSPVLLCAAAKQPPVHHKGALVRFPRPGRKPLVNALPAHSIKAGIKSRAQLK